jgi:hypothetical protein
LQMACASHSVIMSQSILPILSNPAVAQRTSSATRRALEERARPIDATERYLPADLYELLQQVMETTFPQDRFATGVDIAAAIDRDLLKGSSKGWRYADLPPAGDAYRLGLTLLAKALEQTPLKTFERMPPQAREEYLRRVADGELDAVAGFPLSRWILMARTDAVRIWLSHPSTMQKLELLGFADGASGDTDGPTSTEGWQALTPNNTQTFEHTERGA